MNSKETRTTNPFLDQTVVEPKLAKPPIPRRKLLEVLSAGAGALAIRSLSTAIARAEGPTPTPENNKENILVGYIKEGTDGKDATAAIIAGTGLTFFEKAFGVAKGKCDRKDLTHNKSATEALDNLINNPDEFIKKVSEITFRITVINGQEFIDAIGFILPADKPGKQIFVLVNELGTKLDLSRKMITSFQLHGKIPDGFIKFIKVDKELLAQEPETIRKIASRARDIANTPCDDQTPKGSGEVYIPVTVVDFANNLGFTAVGLGAVGIAANRLTGRFRRSPKMDPSVA